MTSHRSRPFDSIYTHGYARVAVCVPRVRVAEPSENARHTLALARQAHDRGAVLALFPELGLSAYSNDDLFQQDALLDAVLDALAAVVKTSEELAPVLLVGAPLVFSRAPVQLCSGRPPGAGAGGRPKSYLPNYREFYEKRQFSPARRRRRTARCVSSARRCRSATT